MNGLLSSPSNIAVPVFAAKGMPLSGFRDRKDCTDV